MAIYRTALVWLLRFGALFFLLYGAFNAFNLDRMYRTAGAPLELGEPSYWEGMFMSISPAIVGAAFILAVAEILALVKTRAN